MAAKATTGKPLAAGELRRSVTTGTGLNLSKSVQIDLRQTYAAKNLGARTMREEGGDLSTSDDALERGLGFKFDAFHLDRRSGLCRVNGSGKAEPIPLGS